jgi:ABC-type multidrug transport system fused ATPase/permease subunit
MRRLENNLVARSFNLLTKKEKSRLLPTVSGYVLLGFLDLAGVFLIGVIGSLSISGIKSEQKPSSVVFILEKLHLENVNFQGQVATLALIATFLFIIRSISSVLINLRILKFLSFTSARQSSLLLEKIVGKSLDELNKETHQRTLFNITSGVDSIILGIVGVTLGVFSDAVLLLILASGLFLVNPSTAIVTLMYFGFAGLILYRITGKYAKFIGEKNYELSVRSDELIIHMLRSYREAVARNRQGFLLDEVKKIRHELANYGAISSFIPTIGKYAIEALLILGILLISGIQFMSTDSTNAISSLALFLASATRIAPAVFRVQQAATSIKSKSAVARSTLDIIHKESSSTGIKKVFSSEPCLNLQSVPMVRFKNVDFRYTGSNQKTISNVSFVIEPNQLVAIVGNSGAGKTTLVDLLIGALIPSKGEVLIGDLSPGEATFKWSGAISYLPQNVDIFSGTIRENVAFGFPRRLANDVAIWESIKIAKLEDHVKALPNGLDSAVGELGAMLSGGQRQRLGIARAVFLNPRLIILDEATSALDSITESEISDSLLDLREKASIVVIAHRLSTIKSADKIIYLKDGKLIAEGTFKYLKQKVPDFADQIKSYQV